MSTYKYLCMDICIHYELNLVFNLSIFPVKVNDPCYHIPLNTTIHIYCI